MARLVFACLAHPHMKPSWNAQPEAEASLMLTPVDSNRQQSTQNDDAEAQLAQEAAATRSCYACY